MLKITKAKLTDNLEQIIKLIYETDDYIYSAMCGGDYQLFSKIMTTHLTQTCLFSIDNITVAKIDGQIVGIVIAFDEKATLLKTPDFFNDAEEKSYTYTMTNYFQSLLKAIRPNTLYFNNVCVDKTYRKKHVALQMMKNIIKNSRYKLFELDCLSENTAAVNLYKKLGFKETKRFLGFSGNNTQQIECIKFEINQIEQ